MHFGTVRVDADLDRINAELANSLRFLFVDHDRIGLDLDIEHETPGILDKLEKGAAHETLAAAEGEEEDSGLGELVEDAFNFAGGHFAVIVVIEITMHATLVTAISDIHVYGEGNAQVKGLLTDLTHQTHYTASATNGWFETIRMPWLESSATNRSASAWAWFGSISNSSQIRCRTISR